MEFRNDYIKLHDGAGLHGVYQMLHVAKMGSLFQLYTDAHIVCTREFITQSKAQKANTELANNKKKLVAVCKQEAKKRLESHQDLARRPHGVKAETLKSYRYFANLCQRAPMLLSCVGTSFSIIKQHGSLFKDPVPEAWKEKTNGNFEFYESSRVTKREVA